MKAKRNSRTRNGNILPLVLAIFGFAILIFSFWLLSTTRLIGSNQEQKTAIDAAALAAAKDLSTIVIEDPNFGFISLSDRSPVGTATKAGDNYFLQVQSINTVLATVRLDMILAEQLNDDVMRALAQRDYTNAMTAKDSLVAALQSAIGPGGFGMDYNNKRVEPYNDAVIAYQQNIIRMNGGKSQLVPNSLKLTLGLADGLDTTTIVPQTAAPGFATLAQQDQGCYRPFMNIPFNNHDFVFTAGGADVSLVDTGRFGTSDPALPYIIPDIVKCEADQQMAYKGQDGRDAVAITHAISCAEPGILIDQTPSPGALELDFSDGLFPEIGKPGDLLCLTELSNAPVDRLQMPLTGDYPTATLSDYTPPIINDDHPPVGKMISLAIYDWLRRGRARINVNSLMTVLNGALNASIPANLPQKHRLQVQADGTVSYSVIPDTPSVALAVSQKQYRVESGMIIFSSNKKIYDLFLRDFVYQPGRTNGGLHAGEPIDGSGPQVAGGGTTQPLDEHQTMTAIFSTGPGGGTVRPTYQTTGVAVQVRFKARS